MNNLPTPYIQKRLPSYCVSSRVLSNPEGVVWHYVSAKYTAPKKWDDVDTIFQQILELNKAPKDRGPLIKPDPKSTDARDFASYHILIDRKGQMYQLADFGVQVYHAGVSTWQGRSNCNAWTYGVSFVATDTSGYTEEQYKAANLFLQERRATLKKPLSIQVGHDEVAPGRKFDPGKLFDWKRIR